MKITQIAARNTALTAIASLAAGLTGCTTTTYVERQSPPPVVYAEPAAPVYVEPTTTVEVVIHEERDFYEPLSPYGHWENVGAYGRCWVPGRVDSNWRPYSNGHWERTDAGWYWLSDEPWGWATYHYGRWDFDARFGWFWVPQTMWAPAWVTWNRGGGYVGWSPLPPSARISSSGVVEVNTRAVPQRGYVFVEERHFLEPVRPTTIVNNTTIINKTVNITNVKVVNKTVINEGPRTDEIEHASGRKVNAVPARQLRDKIEAPVAAAHRPQGKERDGNRTPNQPKAPVTVTTPAAPAPVPTPSRNEIDRQAAERTRQAVVEKAKQEAEQKQRKADAEAARKKQEVDTRAREQAARDAHQKQLEDARKAQLEAAKQAQAEKLHREQEAEHKTQPSTPSQNASGKTSADAHGKGSDKKNQAEAERRDREQQKGQGKNKKAPESQPDRAATNAPGER